MPKGDDGGGTLVNFWDWDIVPEGVVEWIIFLVAAAVVEGAAWWIFR
jgi:hypothetical protein